jgi:hypothetical protein
MPPKPLIDLDSIDLDKVVAGPEQIRECNRQRYEMEHLDAIVHLDTEEGVIVGYKDVKDDEFWVRGHIPGRPLLRLPGLRGRHDGLRGPDRRHADVGRAAGAASCSPALSPPQSESEGARSRPCSATRERAAKAPAADGTGVMFWAQTERK